MKISQKVLAIRRIVTIMVVMYIESVSNRSSPPCILLRESYRHGGKVRKRTLANLTQWPPKIVDGLRELIKGGKVALDGDGFEIERSLPHGHVAAVLGVLRGLELHKIIAPRRCRQRDLVVAMIVARIIDPRSKLATARGLSDETAFTSLGEVLGLGEICWLARGVSRRPWPGGTCTTERWCSTTSVRPTSRARPVHWPSVATAATARRAHCRSSTACCATLRAGPSRSRSSRAIPAIRARWRRRWPRFATGSAWRAWCSSAIAA